MKFSFHSIIKEDTTLYVGDILIYNQYSITIRSHQYPTCYVILKISNNNIFCANDKGIRIFKRDTLHTQCTFSCIHTETTQYTQTLTDVLRAFAPHINVDAFMKVISPYLKIIEPHTIIKHDDNLPF